MSSTSSFLRRRLSSGPEGHRAARGRRRNTPQPRAKYSPRLETLEGRIVLSFSVIDLGTLGGSFSSANAINSRGAVVGLSEPTGTSDPFSSHAFLASQGAMIDLGTLGGTFSSATHINDLGDVVGDSNTAGGAQHAFLVRHGKFPHTPGTMIDLGTLGGSFSAASAINNRGDVVGVSSLAGDLEYHAYRLRNGVMTDLGTLGGTFSVAISTNQAGGVVGASDTADGERHAFRVLRGQTTMIDLGTLGGSFSVANAINNNGTVVGASTLSSGGDDPPTHAFRLTFGGAMIDLGTLGGTSSAAYAINDSGDVVGSAAIVNNAADHAFLYRNGTMTDLNDLIPAGSGVILTQAMGISDDGQIAANGVVAGGVEHAFLLTPIVDGDTEGPNDPADRALFPGRGAKTGLKALIPAGSGVIFTQASGLGGDGSNNAARGPDGGRFNAGRERLARDIFNTGRERIAHDIDRGTSARIGGLADLGVLELNHITHRGESDRLGDGLFSGRKALRSARWAPARLHG